jgi:hypothetical protein
MRQRYRGSQSPHLHMPCRNRNRDLAQAWTNSTAASVQLHIYGATLPALPRPHR